MHRNINCEDSQWHIQEQIFSKSADRETGREFTRDKQLSGDIS